jgi:hypothetical protein
MRRALQTFLLSIALSIIAATAHAQCSGPGGVPFNCTAGNAPQAADYVGGGSNTSPQTGDSVRWTWAQVLAMDHSISPVTANAHTNTLATWMGYLSGTTDPFAVSLGSTLTVTGAVSGANFTSTTVPGGIAASEACWNAGGELISCGAVAPSAVYATDGSSVPSFVTTLPAGLTMVGEILGPKTYASAAALPSVTTSNAGQMAFVLNCVNGNEGSGSGCLYKVSSGGAWVAQPSTPTQTLTVGGQTLFLGQATTNLGTGGSIATATGSFTNGHCVSVNATFTLVDAGAPCGTGGGGGTGTIATATINSVPFYNGATAIGGLAIVNNAVLVTNGTGVPSEATTLPSGLTIPSPSITGLNASAINAGQLAVANGGTGLAAFTRSGGTTVFGTTSGTLTSGHCVSIDASGNLVDAGGACTVGGGGGTVTSSAINSIPFYSAAGTTVVGMTVVNNAVLVTSGAGVPSESATLPSGLTIPSPTITGLNASAVSVGQLAAANGGTGLSAFSRSGNTTTFVTTTGSQISGHCVSIDGSGNHIDAGAACGSGAGGSGTVTSSAVNSVAWYSATGTAVTGMTPVSNAVLVTSGAAVPSEATTLPSGLTIPSPIITNLNASAVSVGQLAAANGGTGLSAFSRTGNTTVFGTSTGALTSGHCVQIDASGNFIDSGGACAGGGITVASANQLAYYPANGSSVAGLGSVSNAVLITSGTGAPSESTTLPSSLTIPSPTLSNPASTGNGSYVNLTGTGVLTTAAPTASQAGLVLPPGVAPTAPPNGAIWTQTANPGLYARIGSVSVGPFTPNGVVGPGTTLIGSVPVWSNATGTGLGAGLPVGLTGNSTIVETTSAGLLTASLIPQHPRFMGFQWNSSNIVVNDTYVFTPNFQSAAGTVQSVTAYTGGTGTPTFTISLQINGIAVTNCSAIVVTAANTLTSPGTTNCTATTIAAGNRVAAVISAVGGTPVSAGVQVNYTEGGA